MKPRLVFVHGIGKPRDAAAELETWLDALASGARAAGHSRRADELLRDGRVEVRFAYYTDLFTTDETRQAAPPEGADDAEAESVAELLLDALDTRLAAPEDEREAQVLRRARAQLAPEGQQQGIGDAFRRTLNAANTLFAVPGLRRFGGWMSAGMMVSHLGQVRRYLARQEKDGAGLSLDQRVRGRVGAELNPGGPTVVVAHSLGSVVTFEALHDHSGAVPLLVTLGSPIGMRTAVRHRMRPQPLQVPERVERWLNFWDRDDLIAGNPGLEKSIGANSTSVSPASHRVDSDGVWAHPALKYLAQPGVAGPVIETLEAVTAG
ncbi:alpha/beta hydrolase [Kitasatospora purpeofusca]|uniref:alpha/beta hydrolase n=1 Tax=Kitasatospora purpeofusca TaxID=67352 RepID=UPI0036C19DCC